MLTLAQISMPQVRQMMDRQELFYQNPKNRPLESARPLLPLGEPDVQEVEARQRRFASLLIRLFPETAATHGIPESPLQEIPNMARWLEEQGAQIPGRLLLKRDDSLPIAGSVKARGGVYEVLRHTEDLARMAGLLQKMDAYTVLENHRDFFGRYTVEVGSTGNLGLSIGLMSAALGYRAVVHMSADAKQWKKDRLRAGGVQVVEYAGDYSQAVAEGRARSRQDPRSYFVDDENSVHLFLGYAAAARRLQRQLQELGIPVDTAHPLLVCIPCGVGGAPGGITFGLRLVFGDAVRCYIAEPLEAPCMTLGLITGRHSGAAVQDIGLTGRTGADGLAVGRPSGFVGKLMEPLLEGCFTLSDRRIYRYMRGLYASEGIFVEPSAAAGFILPDRMAHCPEIPQGRDCTTVVWATGGSMVPEEERAYLLGEGPEKGADGRC